MSTASGAETQIACGAHDADERSMAAPAFAKPAQILDALEQSAAQAAAQGMITPISKDRFEALHAAAKTMQPTDA